MGYTVEFSFDLRSHHDSEQRRRDIILRAERHGCRECYWMYEMEGGRRVERNHCVVTTGFGTDNTAGLIGYLKFIRRTKGYHIESVYDDNHGLVFASATYLDKMDTAKAREFRDAFKEKRRRDAWTDGERRIVAAMNVA